MNKNGRPMLNGDDFSSAGNIYSQGENKLFGFFICSLGDVIFTISSVVFILF